MDIVHRCVQPVDRWRAVQNAPAAADLGPLLRPSGPCPILARRRHRRDEAGYQELLDFLKTLAGRGGSAVLITSRAGEDWPGGIRRIAVGGLALHEVTGYAGELLAPYPAAALRPGRARRVRRARR